ncbi:MAG: sigma-54 interaction domain-containing protein [Bacillota bacterium]
MIENIGLTNKNFLTFVYDTSAVDVFDQININPQTRYILVQERNEITSVYNTNKLFMEFIKRNNQEIKLKDFTNSEDFVVFYERDLERDLDCLEKSSIIIVVDDAQCPVGIIENPDDLKQQLQIWKDFNTKLHFYQRIVECIEEEILITDQNGFVRFMNSEAERVCGVKSEEIINKHVEYLERERIISSSITKEVLRTKKKVNILQRLKNGTTVLGTAIPVFDENKKLIYVICTSKNVEEINKLMDKIEKKENELEDKNQEIIRLKERMFITDNVVFGSKQMESVKETILKIAPTDVTVMVQGESGVGKEVVAKLIHNLSRRNEYPLIKINCGLIPENLLESELFGYENGAFTGAAKGGKVGKVELAQKGTLFLDEIGEMPLNLQVKLLEFLQDREITRIGGTAKIKVNTRIVVATNRDLKAMVKAGKFRPDLFYRLNVLPINIPPLRERKDDIIPLVEFFLEKLNDKYQVNKELSAEVIEAFKNYGWPGNVRELMHVLERLVLTSDNDTINIDNLSGVLSGEVVSSARVICTGLFPLKAARRELDSQLVNRAYEIYQSTYKAARVLQIDQSTVVKMLKKYKK